MLSSILKILLFLRLFYCLLGFEIVSRQKWGARPPTDKNYISGKLPYVIIHHSAIPEACFTYLECTKAMRSMQIFHQDDRGWSDIGYSFAIGGDGKIYEGRGFNVVGAHAPGYNNQSVGICLIGNWSNLSPPSIMLTATKELIEYGLSKGHIESDYVIHGHRQVKPTECPGQALYNEIKKWPHFGNTV